MNDDHRDHAEENYNALMCPACGQSPCFGPAGKGSCIDDIDELAVDEIRRSDAAR